MPTCGVGRDRVFENSVRRAPARDSASPPVRSVSNVSPQVDDRVDRHASRLRARTPSDRAGTATNAVVHAPRPREALTVAPGGTAPHASRIDQHARVGARGRSSADVQPEAAVALAGTGGEVDRGLAAGRQRGRSRWRVEHARPE